MKLSQEEMDAEFQAISQAQAAVRSASNLIGRRMLKPHSSADPEVEEASRWQRNLTEALKQLQEPCREAFAKLPKEHQAVRREFQSTGQLGATFTGD